MKPGGIGWLKPPIPVYRACCLCGRKHRMRPDGSSKTGEILAEETEVIVWTGLDPYIKVPAGTFVCRPTKSLASGGVLDRLRCPATSEDIEALRKINKSLQKSLSKEQVAAIKRKARVKR